MKRQPLLITALLLSLMGCSGTQWQGHPKPSSDTIALALGADDSQIDLWDLPVDTLPSFPVPQNVRPCCAFGNLQKVRLGKMPIPLFRLGNTVDADKLGPHKFDGGTFNYTSSGASTSGRGGSENNGMIYTQRGGFIDLAHVRDTADDTVALFFEIVRHLGNEHTIELIDEIGHRYIQLHAFETDSLHPQERWHLAAELAARLAYFKAESHEIAQWHGYASFAGWPETVSAYSPEDLYSNMLGAKLTRALLSANLVLNSELYNQSLTVWLEETLHWLGAVDKKNTNALFDAIDGHWWDSSRPIPDKFMVIKRHYQLGDQQVPYLVPEALARASGQWSRLESLFPAENAPHPLALRQQMYGFELDELATLEMRVADKYRDSFGTFPVELWKQGFSHREFHQIALWAEKEDARQLATLESKGR
ncbi:DUF4056 domain-containing protein [Ferrimonas pelagia]|uniref:DUF4056 domain-containing protein n=1 Tax=Ferrimonas pelagia TaxID=1177826 RepID=A0ABP9FBV8_9GAMM